ncbi:ribonuclease E inhibitor RraB [Caulobacter sp. LARHSG274]
MSADLRAENETVLRRMADRGDDLSRVRFVDFTAVFVDQPSAFAFSQKAAAMGYMVHVEESGTVASQPWDVVATRKMTPSVDEITDTEVSLGSLAKALGGEMDGWGCLESE